MKQARFSFGSGVISDDMAGRVDVDAMQRACLRMDNFELLNSGGVRPRPGTTLLANLETLPKQLKALRWSDGSRCLVLVYENVMEVRRVDGSVQIRFDYVTGSEKVHFNQVNDLVVCCAVNHCPMMLKNEGGVLSLSAWKFSQEPLEDWRDLTLAMRLSGNYLGLPKPVDEVKWQGDDETVWTNHDVAFPTCVVAGVTPTYSSSLLCFVWVSSGVNQRCLSPNYEIPAGNVVEVGFFGYDLTIGDAVWEYSLDNGTSWTAMSKYNVGIARRYCAEKTLVRVKFTYFRNAVSWEKAPLCRYGPAPTEASIEALRCKDEWFYVGDKLILKTNHPTLSNHYPSLTSTVTTVNLAGGHGAGNTISQRIMITFGNASALCDCYYTVLGPWKGVEGGGDPQDYPASFARGRVVGTMSEVLGGWEVRISVQQSAKRRVYEVQESTDGSSWATLHTLDEFGKSGLITYTGDTEGELRYIRVIITMVEYDLAKDVCSVSIERKSSNANHTVPIVQLYESGLVQYELPYYYRGLISLIGWAYSSWSDRRGWPRCSVLHGGRMCYGGVRNKPMAVWMSAVEDFGNFALGSNSSDALSLTLSCDQLSEVLWMASHGQDLLIGTSSGEQVVKAMGNGILTAETVFAQLSSNAGSHDSTDAIMTTDSVMFVDRSGGRVRQLGYSAEAASYYAPDLSYMAHHLVAGGVHGMCWQVAPRPVAWFIPKDGAFRNCLVGYMYNKEQSVSAWFTWTIGKVHDISCVRSGGQVDELFMVVDRDGVRSLEMVDWSVRSKDAGQYAISASLTTSLLDYPASTGDKKNCPKMKLMTIGEGVIKHRFDEMREDQMSVSSSMPKWFSSLAQTYPQECFYAHLSTNDDVKILCVLV